MISRQSTYYLGLCYLYGFSVEYAHEFDGPTHFELQQGRLYDYLYVRNYPCDFVRNAAHCASIKSFIMGLLTRETVTSNSVSALGQDSTSDPTRLLTWLTQDILLDPPDRMQNPHIFEAYQEKLLRSLELDGYELRGGALVPSETTVLDEKEEQGVLMQLVAELQLADQKTG